VGFANYGNVLGSPDTININGFPKPPPFGTLINNAIWIAIHLPLSMFLGMWLALVLREVRGAAWVKAAIFIGMVTPLIIGGIMMLYVFDGAIGIVPKFFASIGIRSLASGWLQRPTTLLFGLIFGSVWLWTGFSLIVYSAGLTTIPKEYWEAAKIDGASTLRTFTNVTFPLLKPMTIVVVTMAAFRPLPEIVGGWWNFDPFTPSFTKFVSAFNSISFGFRNSFLIAVPATIIPMFVATLAGYGFARFSFPIRDYVFLTVVLLMTIPQQMVAIPIFRIMVSLNLENTLVSLVLLHSAWSLPWIVIFMCNFFSALPKDVEEAARVYGASDLQVFFKIVLPMALLALAAAAVLKFMWVWNDFFFSLLLCPANPS